MSNAYGRGRAVISGVNLGLACSTRQGLGDDVKREGGGNEGADAAALVRQLAAEAGVAAPVQAPPGCVASLLVTPDRGTVLIALNLRDEAADQPPVGYRRGRYNGENAAGRIWMLGLLCDMVDGTGDGAFADETLRPPAADLVEFVRQRYPRREHGRMVIAPCNAGETWQGVRDPAEMVCALRHALPRLVSVGRARQWEGGLITAWEELLAATPEVPRGCATSPGRLWRSRWRNGCR